MHTIHPVTWTEDGRLYISIAFSWQLPEAEKIARAFPGAVIGGPGTGRATVYDGPGLCPMKRHNADFTRTTEGCPNACGFCIVSHIHPVYREFPDFEPAPTIIDDNWTAASRVHKQRTVDRLALANLIYDFNQGLEARQFTNELADDLGRLRLKKVRFAFDSWHQAGAVKRAVDLARSRTCREVGIYVLIGYQDTPESARARLELVRSWGLRPNPMRYQPLGCLKKDDYIAPGWTDYELKKMMHYYARLRWLEHIPYSDFQYTKKGPPRPTLKTSRLTGL